MSALPVLMVALLCSGSGDGDGVRRLAAEESAARCGATTLICVAVLLDRHLLGLAAR